ncbi:MAG: hypothetical protein ACFFAN_19955 [Promethearchaeota archaeon]
MILQDTTGAGAAAAYTAMLMFWLIFWIIWCVIGVLLAVWVYKDAEKRGEESPVMWLIIVLLLGLIGLLIYYLVVMRKKE